MEIVAILILIVWSIINLWASLALRRVARQMAAERHEIRRWQRFANLRDTQQRKWN
jgi:hypothetical protein